MEPDKKSPSAESLAWDEQERFALESGRRMSLRNRLLWLEEMHELVLRWSRKRPMTYPDGTVLGPEVGHIAEARGEFDASSNPKREA